MSDTTPPGGDPPGGDPPGGEPPGGDPLDDVRVHKAIFDTSWMMAIVFATALAIVSWYFRLVQVDIAPVIWTLATLALGQFALSSQSRRTTSRTGIRRLALASQCLGTLLMGVSWHLFGGLQQPLFPFFAALPLVTGAMMFGFWEQQAATLLLIAVAFSGILFSPETNSFIEERYGISLAAAHHVPDWLPRSRVAFADVSTSPAYNLMWIAGVSIVIFAMSAAARALVGLRIRDTERIHSLQSDVSRYQELTKQIVTRAPASEVLVMSMSGRIVNASDRFLQAFDLTETSGQFLLDCVEFAYPAVIKRLMMSGGEEIQGAIVRGRDIVVRVRAEVMGWGAWQVAVVNIERCDDICWRGEVDALDEPVFAVNARGEVAFMNKAALQLFGAAAEGAAAARLFDSGSARWWDIAPLQSARRALHRGERRYVALIRRARVADSVSELSFVHLYDRAQTHVAQAS
jgi:PAS domain-containing protein